MKILESMNVDDCVQNSSDEESSSDSDTSYPGSSNAKKVGTLTLSLFFFGGGVVFLVEETHQLIFSVSWFIS